MINDRNNYPIYKTMEDDTPGSRLVDVLIMRSSALTIKTFPIYATLSNDTGDSDASSKIVNLQASAVAQSGYVKMGARNFVYMYRNFDAKQQLEKPVIKI